MKWPARLPLSTVETYAGSSTRRSDEIVPVEKVTAVSSHPLERAEHALQPLDHLGTRDEPEIGCADDRQQLQADVGRRSAQRDLRLRVFLEVVGREPVGLLADERVEVLPVQSRVPQRARALVSDSLTSPGIAGADSDDAMLGDTIHSTRAESSRAVRRSGKPSEARRQR